MGTPTDRAGNVEPEAELARVLGLTDEALDGLRRLATVHGSDPVTLVRDWVFGQADLGLLVGDPGVEVVVRDFR